MIFSANTLKSAVTASAVATFMALGPALSAFAQVVTLNGAGATFPAPLYERYAAEFKKKSPNIQVNYQAIGSGGGIKQVTTGTVDFGGSDAAMTDAQIAQVSKGVVLVPTAGGAVSVIYNLPGVTNLKLSRKVLPNIFLGKITRWNDPQIAADNPGVKLPDLVIRPVVRADGSGTTFIFTNHLSAINPFFKARIGANTAPRWLSQTVKGKGNAGVSAQVARTPGSIGYTELTYAKENKLSMAQVQNIKGKFMLPSVDAADTALDTVKFPKNYRVFVGDPSEGYPIVGLTWLLVYKQYDAAKGNAMMKWLNWILTDGQKLNSSLGYTRIPTGVAQQVLSTLKSEVKIK